MSEQRYYIEFPYIISLVSVIDRSLKLEMIEWCDEN